MNARLAIWVISASLAFLGVLRTANAWEGPYFSYRTAVACPIALPIAWQGTYAREHVPYFSQHPPVYYSYPVRRTYGHSPYAWPPIVTARAYRHSKSPVLVHNPYIAGVAVAAGSEPLQKPPLRIANPHVVAAAD